MSAKHLLSLFCLLILALTPVLASDSQPPAGRVLVVLDCSGSMSEPFGGTSRMEAAKAALARLLPRLSDAELEIGLMVYGHKPSKSCDDVELLVAPVSRSADAITSAAASLRAQGRTPLAAAIAQGGRVLLSASDVPLKMIVLTDGLETCGGNPVAAARALRRSGVDMTIHVVGLAIGAKDRAALSSVATAGGGDYHDATDTTDLEASFKAVEKTIVAAPPAVTFEDAFNEETLGSVWKNLSPNEELMALDNGVILLSATRDANGLFPNTLELQRELSGDFDLEVTAEVTFSAIGPYRNYSGGRNSIVQSLRLQLFESAKRSLVVDYALAGWRHRWHGWAGAGAITRKEGLAWKSGPAASLEAGATEHAMKIQFRIVKRGHTYKALVKRVGPQLKDDAWIELGSFRMLRLKPRLRIMIGNDQKGQQAAEVIVKNVTLRRW